MEPLNKNERNQATFKFLAIFIMGIVIVLIPFYFLLRLPEKEQKVNSDQLNTLQGQVDMQKDFTARMDTVLLMINKYSVPEIDRDKLSADIGIYLSEMGKPFGSEVNSSNALYKKVIDVLVELKKARQANLKGSEDLAKAQKDLLECQKELEKAKEKPSDSLEH